MVEQALVMVLEQELQTALGNSLVLMVDQMALLVVAVALLVR